MEKGSWSHADGTTLCNPEELESYTFEAGKEYRLWVLLLADSGYCFSESPKVTVENGSTPEVEVNPDTYMELLVITSVTIDEHFNVSFDANGGTGTMDTFEVLKGDKFFLPSCGFTAPGGKEFDKWDKGKPGEWITITADTVVKAVWKDKATSQQQEDPPAGQQPPQEEQPQTENQPGQQEQQSDEKIVFSKLKKVKVKAVSKKKIKVSWKKLSKKIRKEVRQIQIQVSTDPEFRNIVKTKLVSSKKTSYTVGGLKKKTKYYIRVRAYTETDGVKYVSEWVVKGKKTKK